MPNLECLISSEANRAYSGLYAHHIATMPKLRHGKAAPLLQSVHFGEVQVVVLLRPQIAQAPAAQREVHSCLLTLLFVNMTMQDFWKVCCCTQHKLSSPRP